VLETDCPYLAPVPHRGKRNEPAYLKFIAEKVAQLKNISVEELAEKTTENAEKLFGLNK
jgi:TatD DNase family protein